MKFQLVRFVNIVILATLGILTLTGVYGLFWTMPGWMFDLHRLTGWTLIACLPWKTAISLRSLGRGLRFNLERGLLVVVSLLLAVVTLLVLALGLAWDWRLAPSQLPLRQTAISWHWMLGLGLLVPLAIHAWRRWPRPRKVDFISRRAALKLLGLGAATLAGWWAAEAFHTLRQQPQAPRRYTGSRLAGLFSGNRYPVTQTVSARREQVDLLTWRLTVDGFVAQSLILDYHALFLMPAAELNTTLDCTLGWYTAQTWRGVWLNDLLARAGLKGQILAVRLESVTGYFQILPVGEAHRVLLATHVGGETLELAHGYPLRAVVPSRRGWFWVKWLRRIEAIAPANVG